MRDANARAARPEPTLTEPLAHPEAVTEMLDAEASWESLFPGEASESTTVIAAAPAWPRADIENLFEPRSRSLDLEVSRPLDSLALSPPVETVPTKTREESGALVIEEQGGVEIMLVLDELIRDTGELDGYARLVETSVDLVETSAPPGLSIIPAPPPRSVSAIGPDAVASSDGLLGTATDDAAFEALIAEAEASIRSVSPVPPLAPERTPSPRVPTPPPRLTREVRAPSRAVLPPPPVKALELAAPAPFPARARRLPPPPPSVTPTVEPWVVIGRQLAAVSPAPELPRARASKARTSGPALRAGAVALGLVLLLACAGALGLALELPAWAIALGRLTLVGALGLAAARVLRADLPDVELRTPYAHGAALEEPASLLGFALGAGVLSGLVLLRAGATPFAGGAGTLEAAVALGSPFVAWTLSVVATELFVRFYAGRALERSFAGAIGLVVSGGVTFALVQLALRMPGADAISGAELARVGLVTLAIGLPAAFFQAKTKRVAESVLCHAAAVLTFLAV